MDPKVYAFMALLSMFLIPLMRLIFGAENNHALETIAALVWPVAIPAYLIYDIITYQNRKKAKIR